MNDTQQPANSSATGTTFTGLSDEERAAMKQRAQELKAEARRGPRADKADAERDVLDKIAEMPQPDRVMAERLHAIIKASAPALSPKTWYGMPAYAKDGQGRLLLPERAQVQVAVCDVRLRHRGEPRRGRHVAGRFALTELTAADEARIGALVKKAVS